MQYLQNKRCSKTDRMQIIFFMKVDNLDIYEYLWYFWIFSNTEEKRNKITFLLHSIHGNQFTWAVSLSSFKQTRTCIKATGYSQKLMSFCYSKNPRLENLNFPKLPKQVLTLWLAQMKFI